MEDSKQIRVQIVERTHPHYEEYGRLTGYMIRMNVPGSPRMAEVVLESCRHGVGSCFVSKGEVKEVADG